MNINNATGFAGILSGWDAETEQQRRRAEEDRLRQNNQDMFGIYQSLGKLRVGEQQRVDELGNIAQPFKIDQLNEGYDTFKAGAPLRKDKVDWGNAVDQAKLDATKRYATSDVLTPLFNQQIATSIANARNTLDISANDVGTAKFNSVVNSMDITNAGDVLGMLKLDDRFQFDSSNGGMIIEKSTRQSIPLAVFKHAVLNTKGAYEAIKGDIAQGRSADILTQKANIATDQLNAKAAQTANKITGDNAQKLFKEINNQLRDMGTDHPDYKLTKDRADNLFNILLGGNHN